MKSIHDNGREAVDAFIRLFPKEIDVSRGPAAGRRSKREPDCLVTFPDGPLHIGVEVKKSTTSVGQMRPLDYRTTIIWRAEDDWWVLPPHDVVELALHTRLSTA